MEHEMCRCILVKYGIEVMYHVRYIYIYIDI